MNYVGIRPVRGVAHHPSPTILFRFRADKVLKAVAVRQAQRVGSNVPLGATTEMPESDRPSNSVDSVWREADVSQAVVGYLSEHPQAMETLEGIAEWWIMRQQVRVSVELLERVLGQLTDKGVLEKVGRGERALYHLSRSKEHESR